MPFKRAGCLQLVLAATMGGCATFQCPLSGLVGCNVQFVSVTKGTKAFQCPLSGLVGCNERQHLIPKQAVVSMPFKRAGWLQLADLPGHRHDVLFQCPLSGLVGCNQREKGHRLARRCFNAL